MTDFPQPVHLMPSDSCSSERLVVQAGNQWLEKVASSWVYWPFLILAVIPAGAVRMQGTWLAVSVKHALRPNGTTRSKNGIILTRTSLEMVGLVLCTPGLRVLLHICSASLRTGCVGLFVVSERQAHALESNPMDISGNTSHHIHSFDRSVCPLPCF